ncbi:Metallo-dependent phosphatase-like protein, partial [Diaporthe sp. PMI_573]
MTLTAFGGNIDNLRATILREGLPSQSVKYLFNGGFVDKGPYSLETLLLLLSLKVEYPLSVFLNRGNHESDLEKGDRSLSRELKDRLGEDAVSVYESCIQIFRAMQIAAVVSSSAGKAFIVHGGIPVSRCRPIVIQHITNIDRHKDPPKDPWDLLAQLLWNDSTDESRSKGTQRSGYGQRFNRDDTLAFLEANGFRTVFRSHQEHTQGIRQEHQDCYTGKRVRQQIIGNMLTNGVFSALAGHAQVVSCPIKAQDELPGATRMRITIHCDLYAGRPRGVIGRVETLM